MYFVFKFKVHQYPFSCLNRCLLSIYSLCEVFTSKAVQISPQNVCLAWQSRVMHQNVQIRAKGHFLPQFVKHNSNNNNEVWFYKERGRLDMLVWFPAREAGQGSGSQDGLWTDERVERRLGPLIGSPWSGNSAYWPSRLIVQSCGKVIVKHNIEFLQNKETIGRKHNNLCIKTMSFPGAARERGTLRQCSEPEPEPAWWW